MKNPRLILTGATGFLGHEVQKRLREEGTPFECLLRGRGFDLERPFEVELLLCQHLADHEGDLLCLHMAAKCGWEACEANPEGAMRVNAESTGAIVSAVRSKGGRLVYISTDLVFDGENAPYGEGVEPRPSSAYGRSKLLGERIALTSEDNLVVRLPLLFGPSKDGKRGATDMILRAAKEGRKVRLFTDEYRTPLHVVEASDSLLDLAMDEGATGIRHLPGAETLSRWELGLKIVEEEGLDPSILEEGSRSEMKGPSRPRDYSLQSSSASW